MTISRDRLCQFLLSFGVVSHKADDAMNNLEEFFLAAESRRVDLTPRGEVDKLGLLRAARNVLHDNTPGETRGFTVKSLLTVPVLQAQSIQSKSVGSVRPTDWPPKGLSSFGISALLYLRYSGDVASGTFGSVHVAVHESLLGELRHAALPDGGLLGGSWIVPFTTITDSVFFYLSMMIAEKMDYSDELGRFVRHMPGAIPVGFRSNDSHRVSGDMVVLCG